MCNAYANRTITISRAEITAVVYDVVESLPVILTRTLTNHVQNRFLFHRIFFVHLFPKSINFIIIYILLYSRSSLKISDVSP